MNKTPVSILQEMMAKKGTVPNYELIHDGGGSHENTFTYQVTCDGLCAVGTGRCKKDAKHEAATAMLETIALHHGYPQLPASPAQSPAKAPLSSAAPASPRCLLNRPFVNAIGALQDLCSSNNLEDPKYYQISDVGPPHARVFTMQCAVSTFKEEGVATTKKEAKHEAAKRMYDRIMDIVRRGLDDLAFSTDECKKQDIIAHEIAKARYPELAKQTSFKKVNLGLKLKDYHVKLRNSYDEAVRADVIQRLSSIQLSDNGPRDSAEEIVRGFKEILKDLSLEAQTVHLQCENKDVRLVMVQVNTAPEVVQLGLGKTDSEAELKAILRIADAIKVLLR